MTRFARAKGSKASNERKEEDPTPWHIMRQQLSEQINKSDNVSKNKSSFVDITTNKAVLKPKEETWFEFNEFKVINKTGLIRETESKSSLGHNEKTFKKKTHKTKVNIVTDNICSSGIKDGKVKTDTKPLQRLDKLNKDKSSESKLKKKCPKENAQGKPNENPNQTKQYESNTDNCIIQTNKEPTIVKEHEDIRFKNTNCPYKSSRKSKERSISTKKELEINKFNILENENTVHEQTNSTEGKPSNLEIHKTGNPKPLIQNIAKNHNKEKSSLQDFDTKKGFKKQFQSRSNKNFCSYAQTIIANGRKIEIVKFEAFWIRKEDARKLIELKKKLKAQQIPNDKIKTIMKLERRKAEKALSREKTNVCYNCRKFGHKLSECPEINNSSMSNSGICFKCGSTEHTHFECKVTLSQNFRFAVCFVCNEQGHIARQCSLNPQGQYPKGGSCHLCGEVTHLRKDCPMELKEKPSSLVTVEKINSVGLEDLSEMKNNNRKQNLMKNKVVLF